MPRWLLVLRHSVVCDPVPPRGLQPTRLLCPRDFPGKSTGVGCHCLLHTTLLGNLNFLLPQTDTHLVSAGLEVRSLQGLNSLHSRVIRVPFLSEGSRGESVFPPFSASKCPASFSSWLPHLQSQEDPCDDLGPPMTQGNLF